MTTKRRKRIRRKFLLFVFVVLLILIGYFAFNFINNSRDKLEKIGYSEEEINTIFNQVSKSDIKILVKEKYSTYYIDLINTTGYTRDNMNEYIAYHQEYNNAPTEDVVFLMNNDIDKEYTLMLSKLINNEDFLLENVNSYLDYADDNDKADADSVIIIVNNKIDKPYTTSLINIIKDKYFLISRLDRYLNYNNKYPSKSAKDVIMSVNSNIDYDFYTNVVPVDTSKGNLMLVNKFHKLDNNYTSSELVSMDAEYTYVSAQLDKKAYEAFIRLSEEASKENLTIKNRSAYRSYETQSSIYNGYKTNQGLAWADSYSARPGYSEHQTGLALDVGAGNGDLGAFEYTDEFIWMKSNAHKFGFILRYPEGKEYITGYSYEPWHYRFVGTEVATKIYELGITYEEYYTYFIDKK